MNRALTILSLLILATTAHGQSISQLFAFACIPYPTCPDGTKPDSIIQASDGNLYGTTAGPGGGVVFKMTEAGKITPSLTDVLHQLYDRSESQQPGGRKRRQHAPCPSC